LRRRFCLFADFYQGSRLDDDKIVGHEIGVIEHKLDRLAGLHDEHFLIIGHALRQGSHANNANADLSQCGAQRPGGVRRHNRRQCIG
jgi:hypothetical protein